MHREVELETLMLRICEALRILLGQTSGPIHGKGWKMRKGRKFLHRKKLVAWRAKRRAFVPSFDGPLGAYFERVTSRPAHQKAFV